MLRGNANPQANEYSLLREILTNRTLTNSFRKSYDLFSEIIIEF